MSRLQVRCWEITEILLFYYHFLHLQVKPWSWCIGIITQPLRQRNWSCCLLCVLCTPTNSNFTQKKFPRLQLLPTDCLQAQHLQHSHSFSSKYSHGKVSFCRCSWSLSAYSAGCKRFRQHNEVSFCCISLEFKAQKFSSFYLGVQRRK